MGYEKYFTEFCKCDKCKPSTYKNYSLSLFWLEQNTDLHDLDVTLAFLKDQSLSRRLACLSAMKTYYRDVTKDSDKLATLEEPLKEVHVLRRKKRQLQKRSPNQEKNWLDVKQLRTEVKGLQKKVFTFDKHHIWSKEDYQFAQLSLFMGYMCCNPCRRDLVTLNYSQKTGNYVDHDSHAFVFNKYKTKKYHGTVSVPLNRELWKLYSWIKSQHRLLGITDGQLFRNNYMRPMTRNTLGSWLKTTCKKHLCCCCEKDVTCNLLRHMVCTHEYSGQPLLLQKKESARLRMHTPEMSEEYRVL